jgi:hypothetical protein
VHRIRKQLSTTFSACRHQVTFQIIEDVVTFLSASKIQRQINKYSKNIHGDSAVSEGECKFLLARLSQTAVDKRHSPSCSVDKQLDIHACIDTTYMHILT